MTYTNMSLAFAASLDEFSVPVELQEGFWNYFMYGWEPGSLGLAILENDFCAAVCRAHPSLSAEHLRHIAKWFYNTRLPRSAYGSAKNILYWKSLSDEQRREIMEDHKLCPTVFDVLRATPGPDL